MFCGTNASGGLPKYHRTKYEGENHPRGGCFKGIQMMALLDVYTFLKSVIRVSQIQWLKAWSSGKHSSFIQWCFTAGPVILGKLLKLPELFVHL